MHDTVRVLGVVEQVEHSTGAFQAWLHPGLSLAVQQRRIYVVRTAAVAHRPVTLVTPTRNAPRFANAPASKRAT
jgi:hypothetical protein